MRLFYQVLASYEAMPNFLRALQEHCTRAGAPGTAVEVHGTRFGGAGDQFRLFWNLDVREVIDNGLRLRREGGYDAFVVANSLDPAVVELREILDVPVLSFMEVACHNACMMGERFGLVVPNEKMAPRFRELVHAYGLRERLSGVEVASFEQLTRLDDAFAGGDGEEEALRVMQDAVGRAVENGAEVVIPVAAPSALLARRGVFAHRGAVVLDCYCRLVMQAELAVAMKRLTGEHVSRLQLYKAPDAASFERIAALRGL
jgi:Asp/Glu/hydantoin racemase